MNNSEIFLYPGNVLADFGLSLMDVRSIDPSVHWLMSLMLAIFFWAWSLRISVAIIKKAFGFDQGR